jgi:hypothetical protein
MRKRKLTTDGFCAVRENLAKELFTMRFGTCIKNLSLSAGTATLILTGAAMAQTTSQTGQADQTMQSQSSQNWQLVGVNARLDRSLDSSSVQQGQKVEAKLDGSVKTASGIKLDKGAQLCGTVTQVQKSSNGGPSSMTVAFTTVQTKDGKQMPVKATLLAAFPASARSESTYGIATMPPPPHHVSPDEKIDQESGTIGNVSLHSRVQGENSGTFAKKDGDVKLKAGTYFQVGIAPMNSNMTSNGE